MKITTKTIGKVVRVVNPDQSVPGENRYAWAIPAWVENWVDYLEDGEYYHCDHYAVLPQGTLGWLVTHAEVAPKVTMNYGRVLFPRTTLVVSLGQDSHENPAGAYWISGDFLEEVSEDDF